MREGSFLLCNINLILTEPNNIGAPFGKRTSSIDQQYALPHQKRERSLTLIGSPLPISYFACIRNQVLPLCQKVEKAVAATYYGGEALPQLDLTLGPDEYAGFLGGVIEGREDNFTTWSHGTLDSLEDYHAALDFSEDGYYSIFLRSLTQATEYAKDKFFLNMLDFHSHFDALAALRDPQELCYDLIDCPEEVKRVLDEIALTYPVIFEDLYRAGGYEKSRLCRLASYLLRGKVRSSMLRLQLSAQS